MFDEDDSLDDLFQDAMLAQAARNPKQKREADPALKNALEVTAKRMRELYTLPENWTEARGIALVDKLSQTLIGNFREYTHKTVANTRKLIRVHTPIAIDATEEVEGYLGAGLEQRIRGRSWDSEHHVKTHVLLDELMVDSPDVELRVLCHLGATVRVDLINPTQFASMSGQTILQLPAGVDIFHACSTDTKISIRKAVQEAV